MTSYNGLLNSIQYIMTYNVFLFMISHHQRSELTEKCIHYKVHFPTKHSNLTKLSYLIRCLVNSFVHYTTTLKLSYLIIPYSLPSELVRPLYNCSVTPPVCSHRNTALITPMFCYQEQTSKKTWSELGHSFFTHQSTWLLLHLFLLHSQLNYALKLKTHFFYVFLYPDG